MVEVRLGVDRLARCHHTQVVALLVFQVSVEVSDETPLLCFQAFVGGSKGTLQRPKKQLNQS